MEESKIRDLLQCLDEQEKINTKLYGSMSGYSELRETLKHALTVFDLAKFSPNDRVKLTITPQIDNNNRWGWLGHKHFLIEGSVGTVLNREFIKGHFMYEMVFDDDSYIKFDTKEKIMTPPEKRGVFYIQESWLARYE